MRALFIVGGCVAVFAAVFYVVFAAIHEDHQRWEAFRQAHECRVVGRMAPEVHVGTGVSFGANGSVGVVTGTSVTPERLGWLCNDGVTYWR